MMSADGYDSIFRCVPIGCGCVVILAQWVILIALFVWALRFLGVLA